MYDTMTKETKPTNDSNATTANPTLSKTPSTPDPPPIGPATLIFNRRPLPQLSSTDFPKVKFWFVSGCRKFGMAEKDSQADTEGWDKKKESIPSRYMEDENGNPVPEERGNAARARAQAFFELILEHGRAPVAWGSVAADIRDELYYILETEFPFLRYCQGHWKSFRIATNSYSQWYGLVLEHAAAAKAKKAKQLVDPEVIDVDASDENNSKAPKRLHHNKDNAPGPSKRRCLEHSSPSPRPTPVNPQHSKVRISF